MNKLTAKRFGTLLSATLLISSVSFSQFKNVDFLKSSPADGVKILQAYITPYANAFGADLNGGWYNTAKPHKLLGFDITTSINLGVVPASDNTFDVTKIGLTSLTGTGKASTIAGPNVDGPLLSSPPVGGITAVSFKTPPGTNWKYVPAPIAQIGLGLPFGTELKFRFIPKIDIGSNGNISLWGVGVMHSLLQYLPGYKLMKLWDVSFFGGYTKLKGNMALDLQPGLPQKYVTYTASSFNNQNLSFAVNALNFGLVGSINIPVLTLYGGLGYAKTSTDIKLTGNFPTPGIDLSVSTTQPSYVDAGVIKSFPAIVIKDMSGVRANIGLRIKLAVITIHADYTMAKYNVFSTGLGISFR